MGWSNEFKILNLCADPEWKDKRLTPGKQVKESLKVSEQEIMRNSLKIMAVALTSRGRGRNIAKEQ